MTLRSMLQLPPPTDPEEFDAQVEDVLRVRHANPHLVRYGRRGQAQYGIDGFDPVAPASEAMVWQSAIRTIDLWAKLLNDLREMDGSGLDPAVFIFAVCAECDARLQDATVALSQKRQRRHLCPVEILFWSEIRQLILHHEDLGRKWYPEFFPVGPNAVSPTVVQKPSLYIAGQLHEAQLPDESPHARLWRLHHVARIYGDLPAIDRRAIDGALAAARAGIREFSTWPNGKTACIGDHWYYPNGKSVNIGDHWYYPNGKDVNIGDHFYYPNGKDASIGNHWYYPNGRSAGAEGSLVAVGLGIIADTERELIITGLGQLRGRIRRLAIADLAWAAFVLENGPPQGRRG